VAKTIHVELTNQSINRAIKELKAYKKWVLEKETELRKRLAAVGATVASLNFSRAIYNGTNDVTVRVEDNGRTATIYAEGAAVAFIEFGTGDKYGHGHPQNGQFGVGPGTWSDGPDGKGHWDNPRGWYYGHGKHTFGNPPAKAMWSAVQAIQEQLTDIAREVFRN
jgi:hypothetical protein